MFSEQIECFADVAFFIAGGNDDGEFHNSGSLLATSGWLNTKPPSLSMDRGSNDNAVMSKCKSTNFEKPTVKTRHLYRYQAVFVAHERLLILNNL
jgi:hypothetical protein